LRALGFASLGCALLHLAACSAEDVTGEAASGSFRVTASGEALALNGYAFPPAAGSEVFFADGWAVEFQHAIVVVDHVTLSEKPDTSPADPSKTGAVVAELPGGPWAVDLAQGGTGTVPGKAAGDRAWPLGTLDARDDGKRFDATQRYAFGFEFTPATADVKSLLGFASGDAAWQTMIERGYTHYLVGTATRKKPVSQCRTSGEYAFESLPEKVSFRFGFKAPVVNQNCQNPENTGAPFDGEESQRGVQPRPGETTDVQITLHTDHLFWATVEHGAVPLFNHFAARAREADGEWIVTLDDLEGVPVAPVTDGSGEPLSWMSCVGDSEWTLPTSPSHVTLDVDGRELDHVSDFVIYNASTMGHLNQDGLCFVEGSDHDHDHDHDH
jgi:hypothetical protein